MITMRNQKPSYWLPCRSLRLRGLPGLFSTQTLIADDATISRAQRHALEQRGQDAPNSLGVCCLKRAITWMSFRPPQRKREGPHRHRRLSAVYNAGIHGPGLSGVVVPSSRAGLASPCNRAAAPRFSTNCAVHSRPHERVSISFAPTRTVELWAAPLRIGAIPPMKKKKTAASPRTKTETVPHPRFCHASAGRRLVRNSAITKTTQPRRSIHPIAGWVIARSSPLSN